MAKSKQTEKFSFEENDFLEDEIRCPDLTLSQAKKEFLIKLDEKGYIITGTSKQKARKPNYQEIIIPRTIDGKPVFKIKSSAFEDCSNTYRVVLPEDLNEIGSHAFYGCIELEEVNIPKGLTKVADDAFQGCINLTSIVVDKENPVYDSRGNCNAIIETKSNTLIIGCSATVIPEGVVALGSMCFADIPIKSITIPEGVTTIGDDAFFRDQYNEKSKPMLTTVNLPKSLKKIGDGAFDSQKKLKKIVIPENVSSIGSSAFAYSGLEQVVIPGKVTKLEGFTFTGCEKLKKIYIPESVTVFGDYLLPIKAMAENGGVIEGKAGSAAEKYAKKKRIKFVAK